MSYPIYFQLLFDHMIPHDSSFFRIYFILLLRLDWYWTLHLRFAGFQNVIGPHVRIIIMHENLRS